MDVLLLLLEEVKERPVAAFSSNKSIQIASNKTTQRLWRKPSGFDGQSSLFLSYSLAGLPIVA